MPKSATKEDRIASRITKEQRATADEVKRAMRLSKDSDLIGLFLEAMRGKSQKEIKNILIPDEL